MSQQPISRPRAPLLIAKRHQNSENITNAPQTVTYVKDAISAVVPSRGKSTATSAPPSRKRVLGEKTNTADKENASSSNASKPALSKFRLARPPVSTASAPIRRDGVANAPAPAKRETVADGFIQWEPSAAAPAPAPASAPVKKDLVFAAPAPVKKDPVFAAPAPVKKEPVLAALAPVKKEATFAPPAPVKKESLATAPAHAQPQSRRILQDVSQLNQNVPVKQEVKHGFIKQENKQDYIKEEIKQEHIKHDIKQGHILHEIKQEIKREIKREMKLEANTESTGTRSLSKRALPSIMTDPRWRAQKEELEHLARLHEREENKRRKTDELVWEDLDAEDQTDPLMVSEYVVEIFSYMQDLEIETMPDPHYMKMQKDLAWKMRGVLVDWLAEVHNKFKLLPETLFLSVNLIDRFLSCRTVNLIKLQLVGVTALFIASKYEEVMAPSVQNFIYMSDGGFTDQEILGAERYMLTALDFKLCYPSPMNFLRRISKADNYDIHSRTVAKYLMEIPLLDHHFLECAPSMISGAALCLARRMMGHMEWDANLTHYSGYTLRELAPCMQRMVFYLRKPVKVETFIFRKYATKRFMKASIFVREWIHTTMDEDDMFGHLVRR
ncbi:G2/mitotic-specific cyclin [Mortierella alpina]|nr:G2/mitotic-specific cyclin [Mortierella alpina]